MIRYRNRRKQRRMIACLFLIMIIIGLALGIDFFRTDAIPIEVYLSQDLNTVEGESLYKLGLRWPELEDGKYKKIQIKIDDNKIELEPTATQFALNLEEPDTIYKIKFKARRKGLWFSRTESIEITTRGDNEVLEQQVSNLTIQNNELSFEHKILDIPEDLDLESISYELKDLWQQESAVFEPEMIEAANDVVTFKVTIPLDHFIESPSLSLNLHGKMGNTFFRTSVTDGMDHEPQSLGNYTVYLDDFVLGNEMVSDYYYSSHDFFSESLHVGMSREVETYQLVDRDGNVVVNDVYSTESNSAIDLSQLDEGDYFVLLDEKVVYVNKDLDAVWYTVTRNGCSNKVTVENLNGLLALKVEKVDELPDDVYDILIDPGHGGPDGGTQAYDLSEAEEALKISKYIADRLEDHGLKVKMTRTEDVEPAGKGNFDYIESPFYDNGRVEQSYRYQTKYLLANHLNSAAGAIIEGFEVYSSIFTTDEWSQLIASDLIEAGHTARDSLKSEFRVSEGSYKKWLGATADRDYLYLIRESGGKITHASDISKINPTSYPKTPNFGAETILIEYAYIDNWTDAQAWKDHWKEWGEAVVKATVTHLGIDYQK